MAIDNKSLVGFVGQGWIGKNYADDFERRGFRTVRYALEEPYAGNRDTIAACEVVFIAVPTPTRADLGFDDSIVRDALGLVGKGRTAVVKSTIIPGTTEELHKAFPDIFVLHSPEFLSESSAAEDAAHPAHNIIGIPNATEEYQRRAKDILAILPASPSNMICSSREAELFKYLRNCFFYIKIVYMNMLYDTAQALGARWEVLRDLMARDPWIASTHLDPVHKEGRGAGGHCLVKDFAAFSDLYRRVVGDISGTEALDAFALKNRTLLEKSGKSLSVLDEVYGTLKNIVSS